MSTPLTGFRVLFLGGSYAAGMDGIPMEGEREVNSFVNEAFRPAVSQLRVCEITPAVC